MSANIVIVGNQAAGKTVFLTAFSKMTGLTRGNDDDNKETIEYLKEKENAIYRECEWPQSTRRCENLSLSFNAGGKKYLISAFDCPGQDFDALYEEGRKNSSEDDEVKEQKDRISEFNYLQELVKDLGVPRWIFRATASEEGRKNSSEDDEVKEQKDRISEFNYLQELVKDLGVPRWIFRATASEEGRKNSSKDDEFKELKDDEFKELKDAIKKADVMLLLVDFAGLLDKPRAEKERSIRSLAKCCDSEYFSDKKLLLLVSKSDKLRQAEYDEKTLFDLPGFEPLKRQLVDNKKIEVKYIFSVETELTDDGEEKPKKGSAENPEIKEKMEDILRWIKTAVLKKDLEKIEKKEGEYSDEELLEDKEPYKELKEGKDFSVEALGGGFWAMDKGRLTNISKNKNDVWVKWELTFTCGERRLSRSGKQLSPGKSRTFPTTESVFFEDDIETPVLKVVPREDAEKEREKRRGEIERELNSLGMN